MSYSSDDSSFPIPTIIKKSFHGLLLPGQNLNEIFDPLCGLEFEDSGEVKFSKVVWGSQTMTLDKKKHQTLDMFFSKVPKKETSGNYTSLVNSEENSDKSSDNCSLNSVSSQNNAEKSKIPNEATTPNKKDRKKKKLKETTHSVYASEDESSTLNIKSSPSCSVDLFSEENSNSFTTPKGLRNKEVERPNSEEEIVVASQTNQNFGRFSLGSLSSIKNSLTQKSIRTPTSDEESTKSSRQIKKKNVILNNSKQSRHNVSSSEDESNEQPSPSQLEETDKHMKNVHEVFTELTTTQENLSLEPLTKDDELYILQCPSEVDPKKLEGTELALSGYTTINAGNVKYDCSSIKGNLNRSVCVVLPDKNSKQMKIGVYPLAGNIILSENLDIPHSESIEDGYGYENIYSSSMETLNEVSKEYKKKRKSAEESYIDTSFGKRETGEFMSSAELKANTPSVRHKRKHKKSDTTEEEVSIREGFEKSFSQELSDTSISKKKKKKHLKIKDEIDDEHLLTEEFCESGTEQFVSKKKKKNRTSTEDENEIVASQECFRENVKEGLVDLFAKKKKKKHTTRESEEVNINTLDQLANIKTELEEPQLVSDFQGDVPLSLKKKKRKEKEESVEVTDVEETPRKKKKKNHSYSEN